MPWCPKCKAEYREGFTECSTCRVPLVDTLPEENEENKKPEENEENKKPEEFVLPDGMEKPIAVYTAKNRLEAEMVCDMLRENDIVVLHRPAAFRQIQAYSGADARFGVRDCGRCEPDRPRACADRRNESQLCGGAG